MKWFRLHHEARTDKKLEALTDAQFRIWFNLLCFASEQEDHRGTISGFSRGRLAVECANRDRALLDETLTLLASSEMDILTIEGDSITFLHFQKRQYEKPSDAPEETRERKRQSRERLAPVTPSHADVTPRHSHVNEEPQIHAASHPVTRPDTDTESDIDPLVTNVTKEHGADAPRATSPKSPRKTKETKEPEYPGFRETWGAFKTELGTEPLTAAETGKWGNGIKQLLAAGQTCESVPRLVAHYRIRFGEIACNPMAIASNLSILLDEPPAKNGHAEPKPMTGDEIRALREAQDAECLKNTTPPNYQRTRMNGSSSRPASSTSSPTSLNASGSG